MTQNQQQSNPSKEVTFSGKVSDFMLAISVMLLSSPAFADLDGGLNKAESTITKVKDWGIKIAGIAAVIYILWKAVETWRGRGDWGEFAISACYVAIAGAAPAVANWAWTAFQ